MKTAATLGASAVVVAFAGAAWPGQALGPSPRERGVALLRQGDAAAALQELRTAVALDPTDALAHDLLGVALGESGLLDPAAAAFREAIRLDPGLLDARFHLGVVLDRLGRLSESVTEFEAALRLDPTSAQARYGLSVVLGKLGDLDGTIRLLREVTRAIPDFSAARYDLGIHLWNRYRQGRGLPQPADLDEAERELRKAVDLDPARPRSRLALGQLLAERERGAEAVEQLRQAARLSGGDPAYAYDLGLALRLQGDLDGAEAALREAIAGNPKHGQARRALGLILREQGDLEAAALELRLSVAELPKDAQGRNVLGSVLLRLGDLEGAIAELRRATQLDPRLVEAQVSLAQALRRADRVGEAREVLEEVKRRKEQEAGHARAMVLVGLATGQLENGQAEAALANLKDAVAAAPDFAEAHLQLGLALRKAGGRPALIEESLLRAVQLDPARARSRYEWARSLAARGDTEGALDQLRQAVERQPSLVEAHLERALVAARAKEWATVAAALRAAFVWGPPDAARHLDLAVALDALGEGEAAALERAVARAMATATGPKP